MKKQVLALALILTATLTSEANTDREVCKLRNQKDGQKHYACDFVPGRTHHVLELTGKMEDTAYYHGLFLGKYIYNGLFQGIHNKKAQALNNLDADQQKLFQRLNKCIMRHYDRNTSKQFEDIADRMVDGIEDSGMNISRKSFKEVNYLVEASIFFDALERNMEKRPGRTKRKLIAECGSYMAWGGLKDVLKKIKKTFKNIKMGCTGVAASADATADNNLLLARSFDTGLLGSFEKYPLILINHLPNGNTVYGFASAGLHYAGGISGFNNHGLVASLHELQTENVSLGSRTRKNSNGRVIETGPQSEIAPFLVHKVLANAKNLDDAISMIKNTASLGAWTIFIADTKTDEIASVEISGDIVKVAKRNQSRTMGQANHFLHSETRKHGFTYSLNKHLESTGRLMHVEKTLSEKEGKITPQDVIDLIAGHEDHFVGPRSFGRTTTKAYTAMTHVMQPATKTAWLSQADYYPTTNSTFIGIQFNDNGGVPVTIVDETFSKRLPNRENWYDSMAHYINAYKLHRDAQENDSSIPQAIEELKVAIEKSNKDNIVEVPYHFMLGRLYIYQASTVKGQWKRNEYIDLAVEQWGHIILNEGLGRVTLHPYQKALTHLWNMRAEELRLSMGQGNLHTRNSHKAKVTKLFNQLQNQHRGHYDFNKLVDSIKSDFTFEQAGMEAIRFGTVE